MEKERLRRRHLPHWDVPGATYFVTACLEGSIPARGLLDLERFREKLRKRPKPKEFSPEAWDVRQWKQRFVRTEYWLDSCPANRALADPALASAVVESMYHFAGERYELLAYVVMPSHFHWLFWPLPTWTQSLDLDEASARERIMYSLKRWTANQCNRLQNVRGTFWQQESYDHWIRDADELERIIHYIEWNPVKAGLVKSPAEWAFSSAWVRARNNLEMGSPLVRELLGFRS